MSLSPATQAYLDAVAMLRSGNSKDDVIAELFYEYGGDFYQGEIRDIVTHAATEHHFSPRPKVETEFTLSTPGEMTVKDFRALVDELVDVASKHGGTLEVE